MKKVFLSYSRKDISFRDELLEQLSASASTDIEVWYDLDRTEGIRTGADWERELQLRIRQCDVFCAMLTPSWGASENCKAELKWALEEDKPIAQIRVRPVVVPFHKLSQLPNSDVWIGRVVERADRDAYWLQVVDGLQIKPASLWQVAKGSAAFDEFCDLVDQLHTYKKLHDLAHDLYESHLRPLYVDIKLKNTPLKDVPKIFGEIKSVSSQFSGHKSQRSEYLSALDKEQIDSVIRGLNDSLPRIERYLDASRDEENLVRVLQNAVLSLGSQLGGTLRYFNEKMIEIAQQFAPRLLAGSIIDMVDDSDSEEGAFSQVTVETRLATKLLVAEVDEHNALQNIIDILLRYEPEDFVRTSKLEDFLLDWKEEVCSLFTELHVSWSAAVPSLTQQYKAPRRRLKVSERFDALNRFLDQADIARVLADQTELNTLKRLYDDFTSAFANYFLCFDKDFEQKTKRLMGSLRRVR